MTRGKSTEIKPRRLYQLYVQAGLKGTECAELLGIPERTFWDLIDRYKLKRRQNPTEWKFCKACGHLKD